MRCHGSELPASFELLTNRVPTGWLNDLQAGSMEFAQRSCPLRSGRTPLVEGGHDV